MYSYHFTVVGKVNFSKQYKDLLVKFYNKQCYSMFDGFLQLEIWKSALDRITEKEPLKPQYTVYLHNNINTQYHLRNQHF